MSVGLAGIACGPSDGAVSEVADEIASRAVSEPPAKVSFEPLRDPPYAHFPLVEYVGDGPVLTAPEVVTITFASERPSLRAHFERFGDTITRTPWWVAVSRGYCAPPQSSRCVGSGGGGGHVVLSEEPAREYTDSAQQSGPSTLREFIRSRVSDGTFPAPTPQTVYMIYFPLGTTIDIDEGRRSCRSFLGYHSFVELVPRDAATPVWVPYAVLPSCGRGQQLTVTASHELIEAAVDPYPEARSAYAMRDPAWLAVTRGRGEVATLCATAPPYAEGDFLVSRAWNNLAALEGHSPCAPSAPGEVYFNAAPARQVISLSVGESQTLPVVAYSDAPMDPWTLSAANLPPSEPALSLSFDRTTVRSGSTVQLTITLDRAPDDDLAHFSVISTAGDEVNAWLASVRLRSDAPEH